MKRQGVTTDMREQLDKMGKEMRNVQMLFNKVVSEGSTIIEVSSKSDARIEIKPMASQIARIHVANKKGPIRLCVSFMNRC